MTVIALGGNAILQRGEHGTFEEQYRNVASTMSQVADLVQAGSRVVITHGNGPQIGATVIRHEMAGQTVPPLPLHACGSETQGLLGYIIQQSLQNELARRRVEIAVSTVITQVLVEKGDRAFTAPAKPIGPFYTEWQARKILAERPGMIIREDSGRGYRRMVPSPDPKKIVEGASIRSLVEDGVVVIACGGGGIPVVESQGVLEGVDAVIDKDLASERLATAIGANKLTIMTDVDGVFLNYGTEDQRMLSRVSLDELRGYARDGHFSSGSMGPKVEAALRFMENGGKLAVIAYLRELKRAVAGQAGTQITRHRD